MQQIDDNEVDEKTSLVGSLAGFAEEMFDVRLHAGESAVSEKLEQLLDEVNLSKEDFIKKDSFVELVKCKPNKRAEKKKELKDQLVRHMRKYYQVSSYDEIYLYLQRLYLGKLENADSEDEAAVYGCYLRRGKPCKNPYFTT